jgi:hypothetical protein
MKVPGGATRSRIKRYLWPVRVNKLRLLLRRARHEWHRVHLTDSPISGPISVWDLGPERALIFGPVRKSTAVSVVFKNGNWAELRREYWGQAMTPPFPVAVHPRVLILGLGGGTMVSLAHRVLHPQGITVVERDPVMVGVARTYMGVDDIPNVAAALLQHSAEPGRRYFRPDAQARLRGHPRQSAVAGGGHRTPNYLNLQPPASVPHS